MVLFKRKPVIFSTVKYIPASESQHVWVIPQTLEYFETYDDYLQRYDFYMRPEFECEFTGITNLTFFQAYEREQKEVLKIWNEVPEPLKRPILSVIHYATYQKIDQLIEDIMCWLRTMFFVGETVYVRFDERKIRAKVIHAENGVYQVDDGSRILEGTFSQLLREKKQDTKNMIRAIILHTSTHDQWLGAPWVIRDEFVAAYHLNVTIPDRVKILFKRRALDIADSEFEIRTEVGTNCPEKYKKDDMFQMARLARDTNFKDYLGAVTTHKPYPKWHRDSRLDELEENGMILQLIEVWSFYTLFHDLLDRDECDVPVFDQFVDEFRADKIGETVAIFYKGIVSLFVGEGSEVLHCTFPKQVESKVRRRPGRKPNTSKKRRTESAGDHEENSNECETAANSQSNNTNHHDGEEEEDEDEDEDNGYLLDDAWTKIIGSRNYADGGWQHVVIEVLLRLNYLRDWKERTDEVLRKLVKPQEKRTFGISERRFNELSFSDRLHCLLMLVRILYGSQDFREQLDRNLEKSHALKKDEIFKQVRVMRDELLSSPKPVADVPRDSPEASDPNLHIVSRFNEMKHQYASLRMEAEEYDNEFRKLQIQRLVPLGKDQYFNQYWWMDSYKPKDKDFNLGKILVQGPSKEDMEFLQSEKINQDFVNYRHEVIVELAKIREMRKHVRKIKESSLPVKETDTDIRIRELISIEPRSRTREQQVELKNLQKKAKEELNVEIKQTLGLGLSEYKAQPQKTLTENGFVYNNSKVLSRQIANGTLPSATTPGGPGIPVSTFIESQGPLQAQIQSHMQLQSQIQAQIQNQLPLQITDNAEENRDQIHYVMQQTECGPMIFAITHEQFVRNQEQMQRKMLEDIRRENPQLQVPPASAPGQPLNLNEAQMAALRERQQIQMQQMQQQIYQQQILVQQIAQNPALAHQVQNQVLMVMMKDPFIQRLLISQAQGRQLTIVETHQLHESQILAQGQVRTQLQSLTQRFAPLPPQAVMGSDPTSHLYYLAQLGQFGMSPTSHNHMMGMLPSLANQYGVPPSLQQQNQSVQMNSVPQQMGALPGQLQQTQANQFMVNAQNHSQSVPTPIVQQAQQSPVRAPIQPPVQPSASLQMNQTNDQRVSPNATSTTPMNPSPLRRVSQSPQVQRNSPSTPVSGSTMAGRSTAEPNETSPAAAHPQNAPRKGKRSRSPGSRKEKPKKGKVFDSYYNTFSVVRKKVKSAEKDAEDVRRIESIREPAYNQPISLYTSEEPSATNRRSGNRGRSRTRNDIEHENADPAHLSSDNDGHAETSRVSTPQDNQTPTPGSTLMSQPNQPGPSAHPLINQAAPQSQIQPQIHQVAPKIETPNTATPVGLPGSIAPVNVNANAVESATPTPVVTPAPAPIPVPVPVPGTNAVPNNQQPQFIMNQALQQPMQTPPSGQTTQGHFTPGQAVPPQMLGQVVPGQSNVLNMPNYQQLTNINSQMQQQIAHQFSQRFPSAQFGPQQPVTSFHLTPGSIPNLPVHLQPHQAINLDLHIKSQLPPPARPAQARSESQVPASPVQPADGQENSSTSPVTHFPSSAPNTQNSGNDGDTSDRSTLQHTSPTSESETRSNDHYNGEGMQSASVKPEDLSANAEETVGSAQHSDENTDSKESTDKSVSQKNKSDSEQPVKEDKEAKSTKVKPENVREYPVITLNEIPSIILAEERLTSSNQWRYFETDEEIVQLIDHLNLNGTRGTSLGSEFARNRRRLSYALLGRLKSRSKTAEEALVLDDKMQEIYEQCIHNEVTKAKFRPFT